MEGTDTAWIQLQEETTLQANSRRWLEERWKLVVASNFGKSCKMNVITKPANTIKQMLYRVKQLDVLSITVSNMKKKASF